MPFFIFSKTVQQARLESFSGQFWAPSLMFDTPVIDYVVRFDVSDIDTDAFRFVIFKHHF